MLGTISLIGTFYSYHSLPATPGALHGWVWGREYKKGKLSKLMEEVEEVGWQDIKAYGITRRGKWITGILLQENRKGKRRIKLFKGLIKENAKVEVEYKGKRFKVSMIQRINVPSLEYWEKVDKEVRKALEKFVERKEEEKKEKKEEVTLKDFF